MMREPYPTGCGSLFVYLEDKLSFEITAESVDNTVTELQEELDVFAFVQGQVSPEDTVTIYTDADAALRIYKATHSETEEADDFSITDDYEQESASEEELQAWHDRLEASKLTFAFKGLAPAAVIALTNSMKAKHDYSETKLNTEYSIALNTEILARSIVSVTNVKGQTRTRAWSADEVTKFTDDLYVSESNKLYTAALGLAYIGDIFDKAVNAGF